MSAGWLLESARLVASGTNGVDIQAHVVQLERTDPIRDHRDERVALLRWSPRQRHPENHRREERLELRPALEPRRLVLQPAADIAETCGDQSRLRFLRTGEDVH